MEAVGKAPFSLSSPKILQSPFQIQTTALLCNSFRFPKICCKLPESETEARGFGMSRVEEYNIAMKKLMMNPFEYHHDFGMNYTVITENLIVGSQPQKVEDIDHLKEEENVGYILNLQQDKDVEYWGIDLQSIIKRCKEVGIQHMRRPVSYSCSYLVFRSLTVYMWCGAITVNQSSCMLCIYTKCFLCEFKS
ncbi:hypothetical protein ACS0TY_001114 [Phlomoides rotata]